MQTLVNAIQALLTFLLCGMRLGLYLSAPMAACVYICLPVAVSPWLYFLTSASEKLMAVFVHVLGRGGVVQATRQSLVRSFLVCACACACRVEPCCHVYIYIYIYIGDLDAIKRLLGAGANVKHTDWYGATNNYLYI